jgi:hypothetical protein
VIFARRLKAPHEARQGLAAAQQYLKRGDHGAFYDTIFKTLQQYCAHKFHIAKGAVTASNVRQKTAGKVDRELVDALEKLFNECESVRYASVAQSSQTMQESYRSAVWLIDQWERRFK